MPAIRDTFCMRSSRRVGGAAGAAAGAGARATGAATDAFGAAADLAPVAAANPVEAAPEADHTDDDAEPGPGARRGRGPETVPTLEAPPARRPGTEAAALPAALLPPLLELELELKDAMLAEALLARAPAAAASAALVLEIEERPEPAAPAGKGACVAAAAGATPAAAEEQLTGAEAAPGLGWAFPVVEGAGRKADAWLNITGAVPPCAAPAAETVDLAAPCADGPLMVLDAAAAGLRVSVSAPELPLEPTPGPWRAAPTMATRPAEDEVA